MPPKIVPEKFSRESVGKVSHFDCGATEPWGLHLNEWIKGPEAQKSMTHRATEVWLYYCGKALVGYGSFGPNKLIWPYGPDAEERVTIIPAFAISKEFRRKPDGAAREERFAWRILSDIVCRALLHGKDKLMLYVHHENEIAQKFYTNFGFDNAGQGTVEEHLLMLFDMRELRARISAPPKVARDSFPE